MANTGYKWGSWTQCGVEAVTLTTAGTILEVSDEIDLDGKAACEIAVAATYSDHAKATGGLEVFILGECNATYEVQAAAPPGWEMEFTQNDTRRTRFSVNPREFGSCKIHFDWNNTTAGSNVTITCRYRTAILG